MQRWSETVELVARYLSATWQLKSFSCWEEFDDGEHASTLGALVAGLDAAAQLLQDPAWADEADCVRAHLLERFVANGRFTRGPSDERLDGSLLWLGVPFGVLPLDDPRILEATVEGIRRELLRSGRRRLPLPRRHLLRRRRMDPARVLARVARGAHRQPGRRRPLRDWVRATARRTATCRSRCPTTRRRPE